jgi:DNA-binding GntR family transcriptional regulator
MQENGQVAEPVAGSAYQRVAADLRRQIAAGELPVGSAIPSTTKLRDAYGVSTTVVRAAVAQLRQDGLVVGHSGKGVFVCASPDSLAERTATVDDLARQIGELRAHVADLYARLGWAYPGSAVLSDADRGGGSDRDALPPSS